MKSNKRIHILDDISYRKPSDTQLLDFLDEHPPKCVAGLWELVGEDGSLYLGDSLRDAATAALLQVDYEYR